MCACTASRITEWCLTARRTRVQFCSFPNHNTTWFAMCCALPFQRPHFWAGCGVLCACCVRESLHHACKLFVATFLHETGKVGCDIFHTHIPAVHRMARIAPHVIVLFGSCLRLMHRVNQGLAFRWKKSLLMKKFNCIISILSGLIYLDGKKDSLITIWPICHFLIHFYGKSISIVLLASLHFNKKIIIDDGTHLQQINRLGIKWETLWKSTMLFNELDSIHSASEMRMGNFCAKIEMKSNTTSQYVLCKMCDMRMSSCIRNPDILICIRSDVFNNNNKVAIKVPKAEDIKRVGSIY